MRSESEFPLLSALGLYASEIRGDGNCLFNALSDQLYGHQKEHHEIRARVIAYMREHASYYKQFIDVHPGGGTRRNPKRKNAGAFSTPVSYSSPTAEEIDRIFESHLESMAKGGTYGDNMEITAFSSAFEVDVKIYQRDFAYMVTGNGGEGSNRAVAHIAYHTWEHYSSIRNLDGPHSGLPNVRVKSLSPAEEQRQQEQLTRTPYTQDWMLDVVSKSLPFLADKPTIRKALEESKGNIDAAVSKLLDRESSQSAPESSSVERDPDSDNEAIYGPNKRRDRRLSRASKDAMKKNEQRRREIISKLAEQNDSQESLNGAGTQSPAPPQLEPTQVIETPDTDEEWQLSPIKGEDPVPGTDSSQKIPTRVKINFNQTPPEAVARKTKQRQSGPQHRKGPTAREKKDMKKQAQKAARKERALAESKGKVSGENSKDLPILTKSKKPSPGLDAGFRILYI